MNLLLEKTHAGVGEAVGGGGKGWAFAEISVAEKMVHLVYLEMFFFFFKPRTNFA